MKSGFRTELDLRRVAASRRRLLAPLTYYSEVLAREITVPEGFEYDGASVPWWIPVAYVALREAAEKAAVIHDYLYSHPEICTRAQADAVFREALEAEEVGWFLRNVAWLGVRVGGGFSYPDKPKGHHEDDSPVDHSPGA